MSLILDALRKIEKERRAKRQSCGDIRADVLSYGGSTKNGRSHLTAAIYIAITLTCVSTAALIFYILHNKQSSVRKADATAAIVPVQENMQVRKTEYANQESSPQLTTHTPESTPVTRPAPPAATAGATENILVSGIAWQDERSLRRAVVNGTLAGEGAEILGARIVEIRENSIRFSREGNLFEVNYAGGPGR